MAASASAVPQRGPGRGAVPFVSPTPKEAAMAALGGYEERNDHEEEDWKERKKEACGRSMSITPN